LALAALAPVVFGAYNSYPILSVAVSPFSENMWRMQLSEFTIRKKFAMAAPIFVDTYHIHKGDVQEHASGKTENVSRSPELSQDDAHDESSITGARGEEVVQHCLAERHAGIQQNGEISCRQTKVTISSDQCGYLGETWRRTSPRLTTRSRG